MQWVARIISEITSVDLGLGVANFLQFHHIAGVFRPNYFTWFIEDLFESRPLRLIDDLSAMSHENQVSYFEYGHR